MWKEVCTSIIDTAFCVVTKYSEQPKCSDIEKWENKLVVQPYYGIFLQLLKYEESIIY